MRALWLTLGLLVSGAPALAREAGERIPSHCRSLAETTQGAEFIWRAAVTDPVPNDAARIRFIDHAMFAIQAGGISAVTDYNNVRPHSSLGNQTPADARRALEQCEGSAHDALAQTDNEEYEIQTRKLSL